MDEMILDLYFNKKLKQKEIAEKLNISKGKVSKTLSKDNRFYSEKQSRKHNNKIRHNNDIKERVIKNRKIKQFKDKADDLMLKNIHNQDTMELSGRKHLNNESYRKWNSSAYKFNPSKNRFEFDENLGRSFDVPKFIKNEKINLKGW